MSYCFDSAVAEFGNNLLSELESVEGKNKAQIEARRKTVLLQAFGMKAKFRNPEPTK